MLEKSSFKKIIHPKFLGIPYVLGGRRYDGADCIGLTMLYLKDKCGIDYSEEDMKLGGNMEHWYQSRPSRFIDAITQLGQVVRFADVGQFDLILFFGVDNVSKFPTGMGVMVDSRHFLFSRGPGDVSDVHMLNLTWKESLWGVIRLRKIVEKGWASWE